MLRARRSRWRGWLGIGLLLSAGAIGCAEGGQWRPNLIIVLTDDQGYADLGVQGVVDDVKTPHIDALASDGVRFTRAYVTAPQCAPSRAGILTGRYQTRFGLDSNRSGPLPRTEKTLAERLQTAGYRTGMVGKWHLDGGMGAEFLPGARGFDEYFERSLGPYQANFDLAGNSLANPPGIIRDERYRVDVQTDAALAFLERRAAEPDRPFFLYLSYFAPHLPLERPEPYYSRFSDVRDETRRMGLASIAAMDDGVGRIREFLRDHGMEEDSLLFVLSDNGAPMWRHTRAGSLNDPLVGEKGMLTDGGIRVPFVAAWKGRLPKGTVEPHAVSAMDIAATALAVAGVEPTADLDGVDLMPFLTGENTAAPHEFLFWRWRSQAAIFDGQWKLLFVYPDHWMLFDHSANAAETDDVADRHPEVVARLRERLEAWAAEQQRPGMPKSLAKFDRLIFDAYMNLFEGQAAN